MLRKIIATLATESCCQSGRRRSGDGFDFSPSGFAPSVWIAHGLGRSLASHRKHHGD
jgi:hypothetical protein